jgi:hypothetical protein
MAETCSWGIWVTWVSVGFPGIVVVVQSVFAFMDPSPIVPVVLQSVVDFEAVAGLVYLNSRTLGVDATT